MVISGTVDDLNWVSSFSIVSCYIYASRERVRAALGGGGASTRLAFPSLRSGGNPECSTDSCRRKCRLAMGALWSLESGPKAMRDPEGRRKERRGEVQPGGFRFLLQIKKILESMGCYQR